MERIELPERPLQISLRDQFAIEWMRRTGPLDASDSYRTRVLYKEWAAECYTVADFMMAARDAN